MKTDSTIQVRTQKQKKQKVEAILKKQGYTFSGVINLFFEDIIQRGKVPLEISYIPNIETDRIITEARNKKNIEDFDTSKEMFDSLKI
jgi:addiction module RelB/DinJ family antitoxin